MRELQAWMDDLESAGIGLDLDRLRATTPRDNDAYLRSPDEATGIPAGLVDEVLDQDLEGGCCPRGSMGCVPTLVVANKDDAGDAREGGQLQKFLPRQLRAARVVTTVSMIHHVQIDTPASHDATTVNHGHRKRVVKHAFECSSGHSLDTRLQKKLW